MQLSKQLGASDPNQVKKASQGISELLLNAISKSANHQQSGGGLLGALKKDHDGGILGNIIGALSGQLQISNPKTMNADGIVIHLLGNRHLEAAQLISQMSGLDIFKSGVLMQLLAPVIMGVVGQKQKSNGIDLGGLANIFLGGGQKQNQGQQGGGIGGNLGSIYGKLLNQDGDGNMMDDLLNIGMKMLKK